MVECVERDGGVQPEIAPTKQRQMSHWTPGDTGAWERELHGVRLQVDTPADDDPTERLWVWQVFRVVNRLTETKLDDGQAETCDLAMIEAEAAAGTCR